MAEANGGIAYRWTPIEPLNATVSSYNFGEIDSLLFPWVSFLRQQEASNPGPYKAFLERLERRWAIETGIIEGIYSIDEVVTQTLVEKGLIADLIDRGSTNRDPQELVRVLKDHQEAVEFVTESITRKTQLSIHYIRELHQILTRNQPTFTAVDQFGKAFETPLDRGGFKKWPNNPIRPDGTIHEYCPPIQVESELDNLIMWYNEFLEVESSYHPLLIGAWLHHRFTQIHPFQDGNGRVVRALLTWHLFREGYLPVVVSRDDRPAYIDALEAADVANLDAFADFIVRLVRRTIQEALAEPSYSGMEQVTSNFKPLDLSLLSVRFPLEQ